MSDIRIKDIGKDICLTPIEIVMRDETQNNTNDPQSGFANPNFNIIVNLHPTDGTHWVLVRRREGGPVYYFDSFGVETPPLFLEEYVDLGSNERIQQYDESYCGAYCLYMIYLTDRGFRIKSALNILVNQCKCPGIYDERFCLSCNVNQGTCFADDNVNVNDLRSSFANNVIDRVNNNDNDNDKDNVNDQDNDLLSSFTNNDNGIDNNLRSSFAINDNDNDIDNNNDKDNFTYLLDEKHGETSVEPVPGWLKPHQKVKPKNNSPTNSISIREPASQINTNEDLQSWLNDDDIITEATFPDNFRCIISGPSEVGKTFFLKKLILASIYFDKLYIIGPTGDQYNGLERINPKAIIEFIKDIKDIPSLDKLPKDLKKLMIYDYVRGKEPVINEYFCRGRHNNCNMIYLNQNLFPLDRQGRVLDRTVIYLFYLNIEVKS